MTSGTPAALICPARLLYAKSPFRTAMLSAHEWPSIPLFMQLRAVAINEGICAMGSSPGCPLAAPGCGCAGEGPDGGFAAGLESGLLAVSPRTCRRRLLPQARA